MPVYEYNLNDCKVISNRNICLTSIFSLGTYVTLSIDGAIYTAYQSVDGYVAGLYITCDVVDTINNKAVIFINDCPRGYKSIGGNCVEVLYTPIGEFTLGELYFYGIIAIPISLFLINKSEGIIRYLFPGDKK